MKFAAKYGDQIRIVQKVEGLLIDNRYLINQPLGEGAYGLIYAGVDLMAVLDAGTIAGKDCSVYQPIIFKFTQ